MANQSIPGHLREKQNKTPLSWGNPLLMENCLTDNSQTSVKMAGAKLGLLPLSWKQEECSLWSNGTWELWENWLGSNICAFLPWGNPPVPFSVTPAIVDRWRKVPDSCQWSNPITYARQLSSHQRENSKGCVKQIQHATNSFVFFKMIFLIVYNL